MAQNKVTWTVSWRWNGEAREEIFDNWTQASRRMMALESQHRAPSLHMSVPTSDPTSEASFVAMRAAQKLAK